MRAGRLKTKQYKVRRRGAGWIFLLAAGIALGAAASALRHGDISLPLSLIRPSPAATLSPDQAAREERMLTLPGRAWYALELGAFDSLEDARALAAAFQGRGAAGYVRNDGVYRVLAAAYATRGDAQAVQTQLKDGHQVDTLITEILQPEVTMRLAGRHDQLSVLSDAWDELDKLAFHLSELSQRLDRRQGENSQILSALRSELDTVNALAERLNVSFGEKPPAAVKQVSGLLADLSAALEEAENALNGVRLGAMIKHAQLLCVCRMAACASGLAD